MRDGSNSYNQSPIKINMLSIKANVSCHKLPVMTNALTTSTRIKKVAFLRTVNILRDRKHFRNLYAYSR